VLFGDGHVLGAAELDGLDGVQSNDVVAPAVRDEAREAEDEGLQDLIDTIGGGKKSSLW
jgi:hypothetical protein